MNNLGIKWKIFFSLLGFCVILLIFLWLFQVVFLVDFYKSIKVSEIENSGKLIENKLNSEDAEEYIKQISKDYQLCVEVVSADGKTIHSAHSPVDCAILKLTPMQKTNIFAITKVKNGNLIEYINEDIMRKNKPPHRVEQSIIYTKAINTNKGEVMLMLNSVISPVNATITTLKTQFTYIIFIMLAFATVAGIFISKKVSKPIVEVNKSAKSLSEGKYDITFNGTGYKEIKELSNTLNIAAKELSKTEELKKDLIANISHDLRTPLTLITGYAEVMRDLPGENNSENAQIIIDETKRLTTLVNDVMDISKLQSGTTDLNLSEYNLTLSLNHTVNRLNRMLNKEGYTISFYSDEEVTLRADESKISQAFYNLLINAVNYCGADKTVEVRQTVTQKEVRVEVTDKGEGIEEANLPYIWDRYYKVDKIHKRAVTGSGLGLSIVKGIIEMHKGNYGVNSTLNKGSTFWFTLPL